MVVKEVEMSEIIQSIVACIYDRLGDDIIDHIFVYDKKEDLRVEVQAGLSQYWFSFYKFGTNIASENPYKFAVYFADNMGIPK